MRVFLALLSLGTVLSAHAECAGTRWPVKVATDADVLSINLLAIPTTIAFLRGLPPTRPLPQENRVAPVEKSMYSVTATLTDYRVADNGDAELVLSDAAGQTLFAAIPSAECLGASRFASEISAARRIFETRLPAATTTWQRTRRSVEIRGIAFFDFLTGQRGIAPNGVTIHPVTFLTFSPLTPAPLPKPQGRRRAAAPSLTVCHVPSLTLTTNKTSACAQETVTLTWQSSDPSARVIIDGVGGTLPASGSTVVSSSLSAVYSGHATNACGIGAEALAVVPIRAAGSASLTGPSTLQRGNAGTLSLFLTNTSSWTLSSALRNSTSPSSGTASGGVTSTYIASSAGNDTVTLIAAGACGSLTKSIRIFVSEPVNQGLKCCDGTRSPTCFSCSKKQGCCSGHKGVCGCP